MAALTKSTGTVSLTGTVEKVTLPAVYGWVWVKNMSDSDIFAGLSADISEGADGVMTIPAGECGRIQTDGFKSVYLLGTGNALVVAQNYADCPFKAGAKGGELPVASVDRLGGVMVDGTTITADEQGVISAVGGGGLTLIGSYSLPSGSYTNIGRSIDLPPGTLLFLVNVDTTKNTTVSANISAAVGYGTVPYKGSSVTYGKIKIVDANDSGNLTIALNGSSVQVNGNSVYENRIWNIYRVEV